MALPHANITQLPNNEPDATPSLWNTRYTEIDENFANHEGRVAANESELVAARGGEVSLDARLDEMAADVAGTNPDSQNALTALALSAEASAGLALREIQKTLKQRFQTGQVTIRNTGVITGCDVTAGGTGRLVDLTAGIVYLSGIRTGVYAQISTASLAQNTGASIGYVELYIDSTGDLKATNLNELSPANTMVLYRVTVPAGNTVEALTGCPFTKVATVQAEFPVMVTALPKTPVVLPFNMDTAGYTVDLEVVSFTGAAQQVGRVQAANKTTTGFDIQLNGTADNVVVNWTARKLDL
jgi:hypothetical protein